MAQELNWESATIIGMAMLKIEFWASQYQISFQFWGEGDNNVFIYRDHVEIASFGGESSPIDIIERTVAWCEKSNPSKEYPESLVGKQIDLPD